MNQDSTVADGGGSITPDPGNVGAAPEPEEATPENLADSVVLGYD